MREVLRIFFDIVIIVSLNYVAISMDLYSRPVRRGFHYGDTSLMYEKQDNTISSSVVVIGSIFVPTVTMVLTDVISSGRFGWDTYHNGVVFGIGSLLVYVSTNLLKFNIDLPRPYFLSVCKPDYSELDNVAGRYVADPKCMGDENEIGLAGLTFPSLHSSLTSYGLTYFMTYLYRHNKHERAGYFAGIVTASAMVSAITWSVFVGVSRVLDHRHHVIDVVVGALWGFFIAVIVLLTVPRNFAISKPSQGNTLANGHLANKGGAQDTPKKME